jgi:DNA-binding transcriptional regulator GbsR (MarR family)
MNHSLISLFDFIDNNKQNDIENKQSTFRSITKDANSVLNFIRENKNGVTEDELKDKLDISNNRLKDLLNRLSNITKLIKLSINEKSVNVYVPTEKKGSYRTGNLPEQKTAIEEYLSNVSSPRTCREIAKETKISVLCVQTYVYQMNKSGVLEKHKIKGKQFLAYTLNKKD